MRVQKGFSKFAEIVILAVVYFGAAKLGLALAFVNASATAVWPPTGIALAALLILGYRAFPGILLGAFVANATITGFTPTTLSISIGNTLEALLGAYLIHRYANGIHAFDLAQDVFKFAIFAGLVSTMVSATIGVTSLALGGFASWENAGAIWLTWWLGDAAGAVIITPALILWAQEPRLGWNLARGIEAIVMLVFLVLLAFAVYGGWIPVGSKIYPLQFFVFPILVWATFRFSQREAATISLIISAVALWGALHGSGSFALGSENESLIFLQTFMGVLAITTIALAALVSERKKAESQLRLDNVATTRQVQEQQQSLLGASKHLQLYADIIKNIPIGLTVIELENPADLQTLRILDLNPNTAQIGGIKAEDYIGKYLKDVSPQTFERGTDKIYAEVLRDNKPRDFGEVRNSDPRVPAEWFAAKMFPLPQNRVAVTLEDISARKKVQEALDQQKQLYETLLQAQSDVGDGVAITEGSRIIYANDALAKIYGYPKEEILAMASLFELVAPEERARLMELQQQRAQGGGTPGRGETVILRKDGEHVPIEYVVQTIEVSGRQQSISISRDISERRQAEEALARQKDLYDSLLKAQSDLGDGVALTQGTRIVYANEALSRIYGYSQDELLAMPSFLDVVVPEDRTRLTDRLRQRLGGQDTSDQNETTIIRKDGRRVEIEYALKLLRSKDGVQVFSIIRDITSRKQAQESLRVSEERFRLLFEAIKDYAIVSIDPKGMVLSWNEGAERIFGYRAEEMLGQSFSRVFPPQDARDGKLEIELQIATELSRFEEEDTRIRKDGSPFIAHVITTALYDSSGKLTGFVRITRDITARKRAEEKFKGLLESAPDAMFIVDSQGKIQIVNSQAEILFGYPREELFGQTIEMLIPKRFRGKHLAHRTDYFSDPKTRTMGVGLELYGLRKDQREFPVDISLSPLETEEGILTITAVRDTTERKRAEDLLRRSETRLRALTNRLVETQENERRHIARELHDEFGQMLTGLKMNLETLEQSTNDANENVVEAKTLVIELVEKVRSLSRDLRPSILDDLGLLPALLSLIERFTTHTKILVDFKQHGLNDQRFPSKIEITIYRIVQEALTNIARYAHVNEASVWIQVERDRIQLEIADQGTGFDVESVSAAGVSNGLVGMSERALSVGAVLTIKSTPGGGTRLSAQIPLDPSPKSPSRK